MVLEDRQNKHWNSIEWERIKWNRIHGNGNLASHTIYVVCVLILYMTSDIFCLMLMPNDKIEKLFLREFCLFLKVFGQKTVKRKSQTNMHNVCKLVIKTFQAGLPANFSHYLRSSRRGLVSSVLAY